MEEKILTCESVTRGHPDKVCDQISDGLLDEFLKRDANSRCAIECMAAANKIIIAGEVKSKGSFSIENKVLEILKEIGYENSEWGYDSNNIKIENLLIEQSNEISIGVDKKGAGDQGTVYGYATNETKTFLPLPYLLAQQLTFKLNELFKNKSISGIGPDGKAQVSIKYVNDKPVYATNVIIAQQHSNKKNIETLKIEILNLVIKPILGNLFSKNKTKVYINETGSFTIGGPLADCGLTGRKIIVDTYGGVGRHGGGAFSGKDASKIDRSAAYMARYLAVESVKRNLCEKCEISFSYCIGKPQPTAINIDTFNTGNKKKILDFITTFDLTPNGIINFLNLKNPIYYETAKNGHFGKNFPWN